MNAKSMQPLALAALACAALLALPAAAQTLYKLIDKNGKVTYSESAPKNYDGQVIRIDIDPNANTATLPKPAPARPEPAARGRPADASTQVSPLQAARERLEAAKRALADARDNPRPDEVQWVGKVGGGARPVFSESYQQRVERLELEVKNAEEDLRRAEGR